MRSFQVLLLCFFLSLALVMAVKNKQVKGFGDSTSEEDDNGDTSASCGETSEENDESEGDSAVEKKKEYFANLKSDVRKAWNGAAKLTDRNPAIWRKDKKGNVILSSSYTISSPLAFRALVKQSEGTSSVSFEAVQEEYYGESDEDNHANALKYRAKNQEQDDLLSLIEIALLGNVSNDDGSSYCWVPSLIHQDLFNRDDSARRWHSNLFTYDFKFGMAGHNLAFQHMGVGLKDVRHYPERVLDSLDQVNDFVYIHKHQDECADVVDQINFVEDPATRAENLKNNWGLPRVGEFIDPKAMKADAKPVAAKAVVGKPKTFASIISNQQKKAAAKTVLSEDEWPSLSLSSSEKPKSTSSSVVNNTVAKKKQSRTI